MKDFCRQEFLRAQQVSLRRNGERRGPDSPARTEPAAFTSRSGGPHSSEFGRISSTVGHRPERDVRNGAGVPFIFDIILAAGAVATMIIALIFAWRTL